MRNRVVTAAVVFLAALLAGRAALAASCLVVPEDPVNGAVIQDRGKEQALSASTRLADCSQLTLKRGVIHVLYESRDGEVKRQTCKDANKPCSVDGGTGTSFLESLLKLATYQSVPGGKKMDKDVSRLPGIPHGKVLSVERATTFNLAKAGLSQWSLTVIDADRKTPIFRQSGSEPVVRIPGNLLRPGGKYTVLIDGGNQRYKGGFDILGGTEAQDVTKQIRQATDDVGATARGRKLDEFIIFYENNLDFEMELLREELKL
jgi:hypothetical protein